TPGETGSLGANTNISIDAILPVIEHYYVLFGSQQYDLIASARYDLPWQITGIKVVFSQPIASAAANSLLGLTTTGFSGLGTITLTWSVSPITQGIFATSLLNAGPDAIKDAAGNSLPNPFNQSLTVLYGDFNGDGVVDSADFLGVYYAMRGTYDIFADLNGDGVV